MVVYKLAVDIHWLCHENSDVTKKLRFWCFTLENKISHRYCHAKGPQPGRTIITTPNKVVEFWPEINRCWIWSHKKDPRSPNFCHFCFHFTLFIFLANRDFPTFFVELQKFCTKKNRFSFEAIRFTTTIPIIIFHFYGNRLAEWHQNQKLSQLPNYTFQIVFTFSRDWNVSRLSRLVKLSPGIPGTYRDCSYVVNRVLQCDNSSQFCWWRKCPHRNQYS